MMKRKQPEFSRYFQEFIDRMIEEGRFDSREAVINAGLSLFAEYESEMNLFRFSNRGVDDQGNPFDIDLNRYFMEQDAKRYT